MRSLNKEIRLVAVLAIAGGLAACVAEEPLVGVVNAAEVFPGEEIAVTPEAVLAATATPWPTRWPTIAPTLVVPTATAENLPTAEAEEEMVNPYFNKPFSQRCKQWFDEENNYVVDCAEDWAERPLPGGCAVNRFNDFMGRPSCNAAATSFVINYLVPARVIYEKIEAPGIDPAQLVWDIYPNLPVGEGQIIMDCVGAGPASIRGALRFFGLTAEEPVLSKYSLVEVGESLAPNQRLMIAMIGINAKGKLFQHWTVYKRYEEAIGPGYAEYSGLIPLFDDSFFYPDQWTVVDVDFEVSPNIGERPNGPKNFEIVGAFVVTSPYEMPEWYQK